MKVAIVSMSECMKAGRMDPTFHILNQEYAEKVVVLEAAHTEEKARDLAQNIFELIPRGFQKSLNPITTGDGRSEPNEKALLLAIKRFPFLSLAVLRDQQDAVLAENDKEIKKYQEKREQLIEQFKNK